MKENRYIINYTFTGFLFPILFSCPGGVVFTAKYLDTDGGVGIRFYSVGG